MRSRLEFICGAEGVSASPETLENVLSISGGDMRKAITFIQSASLLYGSTVTPANVLEISGAVTDKAMESLLSHCMGGVETGFDGVRRCAQSLLLAGYSTAGILEKLSEAVLGSEKLSGAAKAASLERIAAADKRLADGADEELQIVDVACCIYRAANKLGIPAEKERGYL